MTSQEIKQMMERVWNEKGTKCMNHYCRWQTCGEHYLLEARKGRRVAAGRTKRVKKSERLI